MKVHLYSENLNCVLCKSSQGNGSSITIREHTMHPQEDRVICNLCLKIMRKKHIKK